MFVFALGSHSSDKLLNEYEAIIAQYDIQDKVVRLVTDNASNNVKAFGSLIVPGFETYFKESSDEFTDEDEKSDGEGTSGDEIYWDYNKSFENNELLRIPCFIHTLQLVVSDGFRESNCIKAAMAKVSSIAKFR